MAFNSGVDFGKARLLLGYLARQHRKIKERTQSLKLIRDEIRHIKKVSAKTSRHRLSRLEHKIVAVLRQGGFVEECPPVVVPETVAHAEEFSEQALELPTAETVNREAKIEKIEQTAIAKAQTLSKKDLIISELLNAIKRLETSKKGIKVKGRFEREKLKKISLRISSLKSKLSQLQGKKAKHHVKKNKKIIKKKPILKNRR